MWESFLGYLEDGLEWLYNKVLRYLWVDTISSWISVDGVWSILLVYLPHLLEMLGGEMILMMFT